MGMGAEIGTIQQTTEVYDVAVKVSRDHDLLGFGQVDEVADSPWSIVEGPGSLMKRREKPIWVGHELKRRRLINDDRESTPGRTV
jgi:hypothetical protein